MPLRFRQALVFMVTPQFPGTLLYGGLLLLLCAPVGWPVALGYRSLLMRGLVSMGAPPDVRLPRDLSQCLHAGSGAVAVIYGAFLPFMLLYWGLGLSGSDAAWRHLPEILMFFFLVLLLIPVFLPLLPFLYARTFPWLAFTAAESALLAAVFIATLFLMPALFMQVSLEGRYRGALRVLPAVRRIARIPGPYLEAWTLSLLLVAVSFALLPLFPWLTFWSYPAIGFLFNHALALDPSPEAEERMRVFRGCLQ